MKKILVLGKLIGNEVDTSTICAEEIYNSLKTLEVNVIMDQIRSIKQLYDIIDVHTFDKIFLLTYGDWGNDGTVQSILDDKNLDYTYSGSDENEIMYNKENTKQFMVNNNIPTTLSYGEINIKYPCIRKPKSNGGSADVGVILEDDGNSDFENYIYEELLDKNDWNEYTVAMYNSPSIGFIKLTGVPLKIILTPNENEPDLNDIIWNKCDSKEIPDYDERENIINLFKPISDKINNLLNYNDFIRVDFMVKKDLSEIKVIEINGMPVINKDGYLFRSMDALNLEGKTYNDFILDMCR